MMGCSASVFCSRFDIASRAFDHDGRIFVNLVFGAQSDAAAGGTALFGALQNSYFLYRDDGLLCGKFATGVAGGFTATTGWLAGVAEIGFIKYTAAGGSEGVRARVKSTLRTSLEQHLGL